MAIRVVCAMPEIINKDGQIQEMCRWYHGIEKHNILWFVSLLAVGSYGNLYV